MKLVFIDIDNTLLDFDECVKQAMQSGLQKYGLKKYENYMFDVFTKTNNKLWQEIERGKLSLENLEDLRWNSIFDEIGVAFDGREFEKYFREFLFESAIPIAGAHELLDYLKSKYVLCAASNGPYEQQLHRLELANMKGYFSQIFVSEKIGASKPSEVFFKKAFDILNNNSEEHFSAEDSIIIGDSLSSDIAGGKQYGMKTCLFSRNKDFKEHEAADYTIESLEQIRDLL